MQALEAEWSFRPGITPDDRRPSTVAGQAAVLHSPSSTLQPPTPSFFRSRFPYHPATHGPGPFKLSLPGLGKGQLWLNGHNLGRYWHIGPQEFYKVSASWLQAENELLIFEEEGGQPDEVRLWVDALGTGQVITINL
jgi:hypothetical protein